MTDLTKDEYAKKMAIAFLEYHDRFRREESVWFKKSCDKLGGMFTLADYGKENIYNDFVSKKPIKSESIDGIHFIVTDDLKLKDEVYDADLLNEWKNRPSKELKQ